MGPLRTAFCLILLGVWFPLGRGLAGPHGPFEITWVSAQDSPLAAPLLHFLFEKSQNELSSQGGFSAQFTGAFPSKRQGGGIIAQDKSGACVGGCLLERDPLLPETGALVTYFYIDEEVGSTGHVEAVGQGVIHTLESADRFTSVCFLVAIKNTVAYELLLKNGYTCDLLSPHLPILSCIKWKSPT